MLVKGTAFKSFGIYPFQLWSFDLVLEIQWQKISSLHCVAYKMRFLSSPHERFSSLQMCHLNVSQAISVACEHGNLQSGVGFFEVRKVCVHV